MTLRTFSLLKGLPVFLKGQKLGVVEDLCISDAGQITGIVMEKQNLFKKKVYIALNDVSSYGPDGIMLHQLTERPIPESNLLLNKDAVLGRILISEMGEELGLLQDVYFLEKKGTIVAYEAIDGFFSKSRRIPSNQPPVCGEDAIIVSVLKQ